MKMHMMKRMIVALMLAAGAGTAMAADQWIAPTPEELKMTSDPHAPGAPAIYLNYEETTEDSLYMFSKYVRMKVLTEEGRRYADVELKFFHGNEDTMNYSVDDIQGRTIHPDGTIIPFTGKPFEKTLAKGKDYKYKAKVFTLPDVQVGSIIEYRYKERWDENIYQLPVWLLQQDQYARNVHFVWKPSSRELYFRDGKSNESLLWYPLLPKGIDVVATQTPGTGVQQPQKRIELTAKDIAAVPEEEYMPPISSLSYRVLFYYGQYRDTKQYWAESGKEWSRDVDHFATAGASVKSFAMTATAGATTPEEKLKKLYAAVMEMENTDFTRQHSVSEDKTTGLKEAKSADDILSRKRGTGDQLTCLFVALARSLEMKAYVMAVTNRDRSIFMDGFLTRRQLDDDVAIVEVGGQEKYFDPGAKFTPFGHLSWKHTFAGGIRQSPKGVVVASTPGENYLFSSVQRVADLKLTPDGKTTGTVWLTFTGNPAIACRQKAAKTDEVELKKQLKESVEEMLPDGMDSEVQKIDLLNSTEDPLKVTIKVSGPLATVTSKRMIVPGEIFEAKSKPMFPHEKRELAVYFQYEVSQRDAVRYVFPAGTAVEASPVPVSEKFHDDAVYSIKTDKAANSITIRRDLFRNALIYETKDYADVRTFYNKLSERDQQSLILQMPAVAASN